MHKPTDRFHIHRAERAAARSAAGRLPGLWGRVRALAELPALPVRTDGRVSGLYDTFGTQDIPTVDATAEKVRDAARRAVLPRYERGLLSVPEAYVCLAALGLLPGPERGAA